MNDWWKYNSFGMLQLYKEYKNKSVNKIQSVSKLTNAADKTMQKDILFKRI